MIVHRVKTLLELNRKRMVVLSTMDIHSVDNEMVDILGMVGDRIYKNLEIL
jgi:hypothetical protein